MGGGAFRNRRCAKGITVRNTAPKTKAMENGLSHFVFTAARLWQLVTSVKRVQRIEWAEPPMGHGQTSAVGRTDDGGFGPLFLNIESLQRERRAYFTQSVSLAVAPSTRHSYVVGVD